MRTMIIAEAGVNHNGNLRIAKEMIEAADWAGADYVKFQTFNIDLLADKKERERLRPYQLTFDQHKELIAYCKRVGIAFLSTPFDIASVDMLVGLGIDRIKIPSGEITNYPYLFHVGRQGLPVILSTGMSTAFEVHKAFHQIVGAGCLPNKITVLHCTSEYPTPMESVNLLAMHGVDGINFGYSDHTLGIEVPIAAVALGATVIEKHFTLSRNMLGPDHKASLEPQELREMVLAIRNIELALGDGIKRPTANELAKRDSIRNRFVL